MADNWLELQIGNKVVEDALKDKYGITGHDGFVGAFTTRQAAGAIPNGSTVHKCWSEPGDLTPIGTLGKVHGSIKGEGLSNILYFIEWEDKPRLVVGVVDKKIEEITYANRL